MTTSKFNELFKGEPRQPESELSRKEMDIARSIQHVVEEVVLRLCNTIQTETNAEFLCLAGGVALNCVANGRIVREGPFKDIWIQPAAGDAGGALGAALTIWHDYLENPRPADGREDRMHGSFLGCRYSNDEIKVFLDGIRAPYVELDDGALMPRLAQLLEQEKSSAGLTGGWSSGHVRWAPDR